MGVYLTMNVLQYQAEWKNINAPACRVRYSYVNIIFLIKIYKPIKLLTLLQHIKYEQTIYNTNIPFQQSLESLTDNIFLADLLHNSSKHGLLTFNYKSQAGFVKYLSC